MREIVKARVAELDDCPTTFIENASRGEATPRRHLHLLEQAACLHNIETFVPALACAESRRVRLATWNLERCKHPDGAVTLLRSTGAKIILLSEMDVGMARSGNRHTVRDVATGLKAGYAFGVEYIELGLGIGREIMDHCGQINSRSLHGNAVVASVGFRDPFIIPVEESGLWYTFDWHHRRIGGRIAVGVIVDLLGRSVAVISTHFENHSSPEGRCDQMRSVLGGIRNLFGADIPCIIAGDLNTSAFPEENAPESDWWERPEKMEPLFALVANADFDWRSANTPQQTRRRIDDGRPAPGLRKVDWIFTRGIKVHSPTVWPAVGETGVPLSDHELLTVDLDWPD